MRTELTKEAQAALSKINTIREHIGAKEREIERYKASALEALADDFFEDAKHACECADRTDVERNHLWIEVEKLRDVVKRGTTHIEEEGDFA